MLIESIALERKTLKYVTTLQPLNPLQKSITLMYTDDFGDPNLPAFISVEKAAIDNRSMVLNPIIRIDR